MLNRTTPVTAAKYSNDFHFFLRSQQSFQSISAHDSCKPQQQRFLVSLQLCWGIEGLVFESVPVYCYGGECVQLVFSSWKEEEEEEEATLGLTVATAATS